MYGTDCSDCSGRDYSDLTAFPTKSPTIKKSTCSLKCKRKSKRAARKRCFKNCKNKQTKTTFTPSSSNPPAPSSNSPTTASKAPTSSSKFDIELKFVSEAPTSAKLVFEQAVNKLKSVITKDLGSSVSLSPNEFGCIGEKTTLEPNGKQWDDLLIYVNLKKIDGPGKILGAADSCRFTTVNGIPMPRTGIMEFDVADVEWELEDGSFFNVVLHEMLHVIGIGTSWELSPSFDLLFKSGSRLFYKGKNGNVGYHDIRGQTNRARIEDKGGSGTARSHWHENTFFNELMTGFLSNGPNPMSKMTIKSLIDLGYSVDPEQADEFDLRRFFNKRRRRRRSSRNRKRRGLDDDNNGNRQELEEEESKKSHFFHIGDDIKHTKKTIDDNELKIIPRRNLGK